MYLTKEIAVQLNHFRTKQGQEALELLAKLLYESHSKQCTIADGAALHREQGKAQLAEWLLNLPKGLSDASNAAPTAERVGQSF